ncbi:MAG: ankyrin repeat domain-containing protein [Treponema sp.]|nr:ankyrin repeat domain-containing protein [Spirochaetia bacterium]MDY2839653.1 ankyrin repeat domain-containing protein [Treponema sp.]MDY5123094.1 ankyrin repeat domain-containing protein [Treponema sp.]
MTFLILTDETKFSEKISEEIKKLEKTAKIYTSDFILDNLVKSKKIMQELSLCIIYSEHQDKFSTEETQLLCGLGGFLVAKHITIVTNLEFMKGISVFIKNAVAYEKDEKKICNFISKQYNHILEEDTARNAKHILLEKGIPFTEDCFAIYIAKNKPEIFDLFINGGININSRDDLGTPMLNIAVRNDNEDFAKKIIELGADINAVSEDRGYTALMDAVWRGNETLTSLLIEKGADVNTISKEGQSNLVLAVGADRYKIIEMLAKAGADPDVKDMMGMSAYNYATLFKKEKIVEILKPFHKEV